MWKCLKNISLAVSGSGKKKKNHLHCFMLSIPSQLWQLLWREASAVRVATYQMAEWAAEVLLIGSKEQFFFSFLFFFRPDEQQSGAPHRGPACRQTARCVRQHENHVWRHTWVILHEPLSLLWWADCTEVAVFGASTDLQWMWYEDWLLCHSLKLWKMCISCFPPQNMTSCATKRFY